MLRRSWLLFAALSTSVLVACSGGGGGGGGAVPSSTPNIDIAIPGWGAGILASFDLGAVDSANGLYYFTDRTNSAVNVINMRTHAVVTQIKGTGALAFKGIFKNSSGAVNNGFSGPDGINLIPGTTKIYVGDAGSVKVIDTTTNTITKNIPVSTSVPAPRADEACVDTDDNLYMIASPEEVVPFYTVFSTLTDQIVARITFLDPAGNPSGGIEQCAYDRNTKNFYTNNDGTTANPHGELNVIPAAAITALIAAGPTMSGVACTGPFTGALAGATGPTGITTTCANYTTLSPAVTVASEGLCEPKGLDLGPGNDLIVECSQTTGFYPTGTALTSLIFNRANIAAPPVVVPFGGGDQLAYDRVSNRYYLTGSNQSTTGTKAAAGANLAPTMGIVDAATKAVVGTVRTGAGAHSIAVDGVTGQIFVPYAASLNCADGCPGFPNGGVSVFNMR